MMAGNHRPALSEADFVAEVRAQQDDSGCYPFELFCRTCGTGHLATPGSAGTCRKCGSDDLVYCLHPRRG
jgi:hypothetical protein